MNELQETARRRKVVLLLGLAATAILAFSAWQAWPQLRFWYLFERLDKNDKGLAQYQHRATGIVFVHVPGGTFRMGSPDSEEGREVHEGPVHEVTVSDFLIAKREVTQAQWSSVMERNPSYWTGEDLAVDWVSWYDCQEFCRKTGLGLPTEAQWEYAFRAGTEGPHGGAGRWQGDESGKEGHPIGIKAPNDFGLYYMCGNVAEWCEDVYRDDFYSTPEASRKDPVCGGSGDYRVTRDSLWGNAPADCRAADRVETYASSRFGYLGFRVVFFPLP